MAENKKGFVLYCDLIHTINKMPSEKAGDLFKHILNYVNDLNPVTEDLIIELTFEPIKQQLKRDLKKYECIVEKRSKAGLASVESRKQKQQVLTSVESVQQTPTHSTVTDTVTVKDNVKVTVIKEKKKDVVLPFDSENFKNIWESLLTQKKWNSKSVLALQASLKKLSEVSENEAIQMILNAIAGEWQGLHPLNANEKPKNSEMSEMTNYVMKMTNGKGVI